MRFSLMKSMQVTGTQEDIDLLVAFKVKTKYHLVAYRGKGIFGLEYKAIVL